MAFANYRLCDVCDGKAFYDAKLNYEKPKGGEVAAKEVGKVSKWGYRLDYLGDWAVLCDDCAKTHHTAIVANDKPLAPLPDRETLSKFLSDREIADEAMPALVAADAILAFLKGEQKGSGDE